MTESLKQLTWHQEQLLVHAKAAWDSFLESVASHAPMPCPHVDVCLCFSEFSVRYSGYKRAVDLLAMADCLVSLSEVAKIPGYVW